MVVWNFFGNKAEGGSWKNPHGQGGGFSKCPCLSTRGEGGSKKPKKLSTWFVDDPLRSELKLEQKFNLRDAVYCLPQRYNSINGFCNFSNGATFKEVKEKFHKTLILASKVKYNTSFFLFSGNYCVPLEGQGWNHVFCLTFEEWRKYWM